MCIYLIHSYKWQSALHSTPFRSNNKWCISKDRQFRPTSCRQTARCSTIPSRKRKSLIFRPLEIPKPITYFFYYNAKIKWRENARKRNKNTQCVILASWESELTKEIRIAERKWTSFISVYWTWANVEGHMSTRMQQTQTATQVVWQYINSDGRRFSLNCSWTHATNVVDSIHIISTTRMSRIGKIVKFG